MTLKWLLGLILAAGTAYCQAPAQGGGTTQPGGSSACPNSGTANYLCGSNSSGTVGLYSPATVLGGNALSGAVQGSIIGNVSSPQTLTGMTISGWGDSLTGGNEDGTGNTYPLYLATDMATTVNNYGVGGNTSTQIATRFLATPSTFGQCNIIWAGRNNSSAQSTVLADVVSMVAAMTTPKCFLVLSVINGYGGSENYNTTNYNQIVALNAALAAAYPNNYFDIRTAIVQSYNPSLPQDVIDHGNDVPPTSLRAVELQGTITSGALTSSATTFTVSATLQGTGYIVIIDSEQIYVTGVSGSNVTNCIRGYNGTTAASHLANANYSSVDPLHLGYNGYKIVAQQVAAWLSNPATLTPAVGAVGNPQPIIASNIQASSIQAPIGSSLKIQGGTFPAGGLISQGTTATDSAPLGSELTSSGTTTSTGWTGTFNSYSNGASNTSPLTYAPTISSSTSYQVVITVSGYSAGSISITFGGVALNGMSSNSTQTIGPKTTSTAALVITPTSTFVGTITASIKQISPITSYAVLGNDSTGANSLILLQTLASLQNYFQGGGTYNTTGSNNSAQGYQALYSNTTGSYNSAQGFRALYSNTTGSNNSAQGANALYSNTTGGNNSAQGQGALYSNTNGSNNSAQGLNALSSNTNGSNNSAQGLNALYSNTTGSYNSAQGHQAGYGTSSTNANTTGSNNTFVGYEAAPGSSTQQNYMTVMGASATGTCSYCIVLGRQGTAANGSDVTIFNGKFTVSSGTGNPALPTASTVPQACGWVTDALAAPTYLGTATGGGSVLALVCSNGTNWQYH